MDFKQQLERIEKINQLLKKNITLREPDNIQMAGMIHLFEMLFEMCMKILHDYLETKQQAVKNPHEIIHSAFHQGIIIKGEIWLQALLDKELAPDVLEEEKMAMLVRRITRDYYPAFTEMIERLEKKLKREHKGF